MNAVKARFRQIAPPFLLDETVYNTLADHPSIDREPPSPLRSFLLDALLGSSLTELTQQVGLSPGSENKMGNYHRQLPIEATKISTPRILWGRFEALSRLERTPLKQTCT